MAKTPKKQVVSLIGFDASHIKQTEQYVQAIDALYNQAIIDYAKIASTINFDHNKPFSFKDYPGTKAKAQAITNNLASNMETVITKGSRSQWLYACEKNDLFLESIINTSSLPKKKLSKWQDKNLDALKAFQTRKVNGLGLSDRIWNYAGQMQNQMELGIDIALGDGKSAALLSRDLKKYLVDPDKLFRRVRDKHGQLVLSKNAKTFNPGQGKYRSSYKNAMRLTRTEINMAYRESDQLRWQQLEFVVGFEVKLSNNHTLNGVPFVDICDDLKGKYPKEFKFKGWHPQCRCHAVPILQDPDEFNTDELNELKAAINGTEYNQLKSRNTITDVPQGFKDWISANAERSQGWKSQPYFIKDNFKGGNIAGGLKFNVSTQKNVLKNSLVMSEEEALKVAKLAEENGNAVLYRGDTRDKGIDFKASNTDYSLDGEVKNKARFNFFTDKKDYAVEYATSAMNESIRAKSANPNVTIISIEKDVNLFDFNKLSAKQAAEFELEMDKYKKGYLDSYRKGVMNDLITMDEKKFIKKYPWSSNNKKDISTRNIINHPQTYSDFELGNSFKEYLQDNNYDGFVFQEYKMGAEYGIIDKNKFKVIAKYFIKQ